MMYTFSKVHEPASALPDIFRCDPRDHNAPEPPADGLFDGLLCVQF